jgi:flagellar basal-body rod protein FlgF
MENAQLIGLSRQIALQRQMDVLANNMANLNTVGFKAEALLFEEFKMPVAEASTFQAGDQTLSFTSDWATMADFSGGSIMQTGNELDVALEGKGFFVIQTPQGERYTRNGTFQLNQNGELVNTDGFQVIADGGFLTFGPDEFNISIGKDGAVSSSAGAKGQLRVVEFENPNELTRAGGNLFDGTNPLPSLDTRVFQGALERSNVSGVGEITEMIRVTRAYTSLADVMKKLDELRRNSISRLGDLNA